MANPQIIEACKENRVSLEEFFGPLKARRIVAARRAAILRFRAQGISYETCGRLMHRDRTTIRYWVREDIRKAKLVAMRTRKLRPTDKKRRKYMRREQLRSHCAEVLRLFDSGLTYKEIARLLKNSENNVRRWLSTARKHKREAQHEYR